MYYWLILSIQWICWEREISISVNAGCSNPSIQRDVDKTFHFEDCLWNVKLAHQIRLILLRQFASIQRIQNPGKDQNASHRSPFGVHVLRLQYRLGTMTQLPSSTTSTKSPAHWLWHFNISQNHWIKFTVQSLKNLTLGMTKTMIINTNMFDRPLWLQS